ncbi:MAG: nuclear transport factor 2 family protein [Bacteroidota bacterium]
MARIIPRILPILYLFAFVAGVSDAAAQTENHHREDVEQALVDLNERILIEYVVHNNTGPLQATAAERFFAVTPGGIEPRSHVIATVGNLDVDSVSVMNTEIHLYGSTALLAGVLRGQGTLSGRPLPPLSYLSVYVKEDEQWRLAARSLTPMVARPQR